MIATFRRFNACVAEKLWDMIVPQYSWGILVQNPPPHQVNLLYNVKGQRLYAQIYPHNKLIPFQQLPQTVFHPFPASSYSTEKKDENLFDKMDKTAYRLFYVDLSLEDRKILSALWMQAMEGTCKEPKPSPKQGAMELEFWTEWENLGNMSKEDAAKKYLKIAEKYI